MKGNFLIHDHVGQMSQGVLPLWNSKKDYTRSKFICCRDLVIRTITKTVLQYFRVYDSSLIVQRQKYRFVLTTTID